MSRKGGFKRLFYCLLCLLIASILCLWYHYIYRHLKSDNKIILAPIVSNQNETLHYTIRLEKEANLSRETKNNLSPSENSKELHFVHIPKCGGTSMTAVLRQVACHMDPVSNKDCCTNPGFCDWHANRRCSVIKGCINHFPHRNLIFKANLRSITILREPYSRLLSAWFYRGHSPNSDYFQVRPEFKEIKNGRRPKATFEEYLDMHEYQNIQTRMLGADSFPYRNITVTDKIYHKAVEALQKFYFIGIQEAYDLSVELLLRKLKVKIFIPINQERAQNSKDMKRKKSAIQNNKFLTKKINQVNIYDIKLYSLAVSLFCRDISEFPDLFAKLLNTTSISCPNDYS